MKRARRRDTASLPARLAPLEEAGDGGPPAADTIRPGVARFFLRLPRGLALPEPFVWQTPSETNLGLIIG